MPSPWPALRAQLLRSTQTLAFHRQFRALRATYPALAKFADLPALLDALHGEGGDPETRNAILASLVRHARLSPEPATTILMLALWPGLDAVHRRLARHFRGDAAALVSEISARLVAGIRGLDLTRVRRVAATLIRNCQRDIVRSLQRAAREASTRVELDEEGIVATEPGAALSGGALPDEAVRLARRIRPLVGADATVVVAVAVLGETQRDAAAALGFSHDAARKRYQRALKRLRVRVEDFL